MVSRLVFFVSYYILVLRFGPFDYALSSSLTRSSLLVRKDVKCGFHFEQLFCDTDHTFSTKVCVKALIPILALMAFSFPYQILLPN